MPNQPDMNSRFGTNLVEPSTLASESPEAREAFNRWVRAGRGTDPRYLQYQSFSGTDIKAAIWIPPNPIGGRLEGTYKIWAELQTLTVSSARPAGPVRCLGLAGVRDYVRGVRTIAGSMVFTIFDRDVFFDVYQKSDKESPAEYPIFVDMIPPFHIMINAGNEMGGAATASIIDVTLTNFGTTYSIDDLMLEATYTYVAKYVTPLSIKKGWRSGLGAAVSKMTTGLTPASARSKAPVATRVEPVANMGHTSASTIAWLAQQPATKYQQKIDKTRIAKPSQVSMVTQRWLDEQN